ncbi:MAG: bifunctional oligoribonuclease/PAP phosphatase NrnA [Litorilinea sp.]
MGVSTVSAIPVPVLDPSPQPPAELLAALRAGQDILCLSHIGPDGDAVGSVLGMGWLLRALGKTPTLALQDAVPHEHTVLPGADTILTSSHADFRERVKKHAFDLIVVLDASSSDRMGNVYNAPVHDAARLVIIDHHVTNTRFGAVNWVAPECAATCEMLVYLAEAAGVPLAGPLAECLLTGMVTDTLGFRTTNTTPAVMGAAMQLMAGGANLAEIAQRTVNRRPLSQLKVWAAVLPAFEIQEGVIWANVSREHLKAAGHTNGDLDLSSFLITVDDADMSAAFTEKLDEKGVTQIDCSFRAKPDFDVAQVALAFGGGGHPLASGCKIAGSLDEVSKRVVAALQEARRVQNPTPVSPTTPADTSQNGDSQTTDSQAAKAG